MKQSTVFSIGHGSKEIETLITELNSFEIKYLLDVRSKPYSKWNPQFNQSSLEMDLKESGIQYVFMGDKLGGLPEDRSCYDSNGKVVYDLIQQKRFFKEGLQRLINANNNKVNLAVMCSESKPEECHRSKLIGQALLKCGISMNHIVSENKVKSQELVMNELTKGKGTIDLFGNETDFTSRKSY